MYRGIALSASLMCVDWLNVGEQLTELESCEIDFLHYDIVDGNFANDFTMGSSIIDKVNAGTKLAADYHLMVEEPSRIFDIFEMNSDCMFSVHQEACRNLHRDLGTIRSRGAKAGVALSPATNLEVLEYIIEDIDVVILMTVNPGFKGQPFVPQVAKKVEKLKLLIDRHRVDTRISVDGNINPNTIPTLVAAGADTLVLGSSGLFLENKPISEAIDMVRDAIDLGLAGGG